MTYREKYAAMYGAAGAQDVHSNHCPDSFQGLTVRFSCPQRLEPSTTCDQCWDTEEGKTHDAGGDQAEQ